MLATNGRDRLRRLREESPELVVTDFMMPLLTGADFVRAMRSLPEFRAIPVIMVSATSESLALADETLGVSEFLKKPFEWGKLLASIVHLIGAGDRDHAPV